MSSHILTWDGPDQTRLKSNAYSDGKGRDQTGMVSSSHILTCGGSGPMWLLRLSIYSHGEGAQVVQVGSQREGGGVAEVEHILTWDK